LSAFALPAKLPNCTAHAPPAASREGPAGAATIGAGGAACAGGSDDGVGAARGADSSGVAGALSSAGAAAEGSSVGAPAAAAIGVGSAVVAWWVKSTVTVCTVAVVGGDGGAVGRFGPDNSSGTINTTSANSIVAPSKRSLTRRSMH
jgi:hypothetical protein